MSKPLDSTRAAGLVAAEEVSSADDGLISVALPVGLAHAVDAWIAIQLEPKPSRAEAITRLLREALGTRFGS